MQKLSLTPAWPPRNSGTRSKWYLGPESRNTVAPTPPFLLICSTPTMPAYQQTMHIPLPTESFHQMNFCLGQWIWGICFIGFSVGYIIWIRWDPPLVPEDCCPFPISAGGVFVQSFDFVFFHTSSVEVEHNHTSTQDKPTHWLCRLPTHLCHVHPVSNSRKTSHQKILLPHTDTCQLQKPVQWPICI